MSDLNKRNPGDLSRELHGVLIDFAGKITRIAPEDVAHFQIKNLAPRKVPKVKHQTKKGQTL